MGQQTSNAEYYKIAFEQPQPSSYETWPTKEKPQEFYKITSVWLELGQSITIIERSTYSALEWLGDVGGLFDAFHGIGNVLLGPIAAFAVKANVLSHSFRQSADDDSEKEKATNA